MPDLAEQALPAAEKLLQSNESQLYEQLGIRAAALERDPSLAGSLEPQVRFDGTTMGLKEDVRELGRRIFERWQAEAHALVCGQSGDASQDRQKLLDAIGVSETATAAALSALLVASLHVPLALAPVVAAIVVKRFFRPAYEEMCRAWASHLPQREG